PPAALLAVGLAQQSQAVAPAAVVAATAQAVAMYAARRAAGGLLSVRAVSLAKEVLHNMLITKLQNAAVILLAGCVVAIGAGLAARQVLPAKQPEANRQDAPKP